jgi:hypothetical protein
MKVKKLDKRMLGYDLFKYQVSFLRRNAEQFVDIRNWCWQQWGPSSELEFVYALHKDPTWAWVSDHGRYRVLLKSDKEYSWYILKWINK